MFLNDTNQGRYCFSSYMFSLLCHDIEKKKKKERDNQGVKES
jgi:hypothetical protein